MSGGSLRLVQLHQDGLRKVAVVEEPSLRLLNGWNSVYAIARSAAVGPKSITELVADHASDELLSYDAVYHGTAPWRLAVPIDHPDDPARCLVSGTGLTHLGSANDRNTMHLGVESEMTDSMKMFRWGVEGGRPDTDTAGVAPEWFYKGNGSVLRAQMEALTRPGFAEDGGEEAEIAGVYLIAPNGEPRRIGMAVGNEFADHRFEKRNYLNLAGSKLRTCSLGPELVIDPDFASVAGTVTIERADTAIWHRDICSGEAEMCHSLQNIEHHHFKFDGHRRPGDLHVHYFGACALSFGAGIELQDGDVMRIAFDGFGRALRNPLRVETAQGSVVRARALA